MTEDPVSGLLGSLERAIMEVVWSEGTATVRDVHVRLPDPGPAYTTVMTVMARLADKGILSRRLEGRAYVYEPVQKGRMGFVHQVARQEVRHLLDQFGAIAMAEFVGQLDADDLQRLEDLLASRDTPADSDS